MSVTLTLRCGGCDATTEGTGPLRRRFRGTHGDHGWGSWVLDAPQDLAPAGWVMFDPYTQATYCPTCWAEIDPGPRFQRLPAECDCPPSPSGDHTEACLTTGAMSEEGK